jgi:hypothetical protein
MLTIYRVRTANVDGTQYSDGVFYLDKDDAVKATQTSTGDKDGWKEISEVVAYGKGEYSEDNIKRQAALRKLTSEERILLGLV